MAARASSRPRSRLRAVLAAVAAMVVLAGSALAEVPALRRGVNFELWQHWTNRSEFLAPDHDRTDFPDWQKAVDDTRLAGLRRQGFDFVRLNVDPSPFFWLDGRTEPLLTAVERAVARLTAAGFAVVIDLHPVPDMEDRPFGLHTILGTGGKRPSAAFARYLALVRDFATRFRDHSAERVALELMNEPDQDWFSWAAATDRWPGRLAELHAAARAVAPRLPLVMTGARGGGLEGLLRLDARRYAGDDALLWSFHYYEPHAVTHSGQPWERGVAHFLTKLPYPADALDPALRRRLVAEAQARVRAEIPDAETRAELDRKIEAAAEDYAASGAGPLTVARDFDRVATWAAANGVPPGRILLGEFGVFQDAVDPATRATILRVARTAAEAEGFAWAVYTAGLTRARASFGILGDTTTMTVEEPVARALGLR